MLDLEALLAPVDGPNPSGTDLRYDPRYAELEHTVAGKAERQVGSTVQAAEPPDWRAALDLGQALLGSTKDLRVAVVVARALLERHGFAGLADGLALVGGLVDKFWDSFHPQLDAEDDNDPTARVSAMAELTHLEAIKAVRSTPLVSSRTFGVVSLKLLDAAMGPAHAAPAEGSQAPPTLATVEAAFQEVSTEALAEASDALARCAKAAQVLADTWADKVAVGPDFTELRVTLSKAHQAVRTRLDQRAPAEAAGGPAVNGVNATGATASARARGEVETREDVLRALDAICAYYARHEPSSPVPLLLQRSKRLVSMSFLDIIRDLNPEAIENVQRITGSTE